MRALLTLGLLLLPSLAHAQAGRAELVTDSRRQAVAGARVHFAHAIELMQDGYFEEACSWLDRALLVVDSPALRWNAAVCRNETGERAAVVQHLRAFLVTATPDHPHFDEAYAWSQRVAPWPSATRAEASTAPPVVAAPPSPVVDPVLPQALAPSPREVAEASVNEALVSPGPTDGDDAEPWIWAGVIAGLLVVAGAAIVIGLTLTPANDADLPVDPAARFVTR